MEQIWKMILQFIYEFVNDVDKILCRVSYVCAELSLWDTHAHSCVKAALVHIVKPWPQTP